MLIRRASGILLHITSLPSSHGIGDFGSSAYKFAQLLSKSKQSYWQLLPLTPTDEGYRNSPYQPTSTFAGNSCLISLDKVRELLRKELIPDVVAEKAGEAHYHFAKKLKRRLLKKAYLVWKNEGKKEASFDDFCDENSYWLDDYALYMSIKLRCGKPWYLWPSAIRDREGRVLNQKASSLKEDIEFEKFVQYIFFQQWSSLKNYCKKLGIKVIGDLPFYVAYDSADVWAHPELFKLDMQKRPLFVAGVPPDYFSATGQLWGNPVYDWDKAAATDFEWWIKRIQQSLSLYDLLRLDHFRGLISYWEVPADQTCAIKGKWVETPSDEFFKLIKRYFPELPFIAEDLGQITEDVIKARKMLGIPGMKVLLFAFLDESHLPYNHEPNSVVYTGTHDTNTAKGWFTQEATQEEKEKLFRYVGRRFGEDTVSWELIRLSMSSVSNLSIVPVQDVLSLGSDARMNNPAGDKKNWLWRMTKTQMMSDAFEKLADLTETFGRA